MLDLGYRHVDVFSRRALQGNGLVVVLDAEHLSAPVMQELTREVRQFETAFLAGVDLPGRSARLRIFTEDEELDFAGHPVLGAAAVLHGLLPAPDAEDSWALAVAQRTVEVRTRGADRWVDATMDQGIPKLGPAIAGELAEAYRDALNLAPGQLHPALPVQVASTGLPYLIVPVQSGLERARISHPGFEGLIDASGAKFVYVLDPDRPEGRTWDNAGRVEDVATGSAAGPAAGYLLHHGVRPVGEPILVHQGRFTGRPSTIEVRPRPGRPAVGRRAGGAGRGRTLPRPSDLTAAASAGRNTGAPVAIYRRAPIRSAFRSGSVSPDRGLRQVMLPTFELPVLARRTVTCKAAARHRVASSLCPMENIGGPWTERENDRSGRAPEASTQLTLGAQVRRIW